MMTPDEAKKKLDELGIDINSWEDKEAQGVRPPFVREQVAHLQRLKSLLESEQRGLEEKASKARELLLRLRHGGGS